MAIQKFTIGALADGAVDNDAVLDNSIDIGKLGNVNLSIAPEVLEIQVDAPAAGQDTQWLWTWEQSTLPYARRTITNSPEVQVPLYKQGTYTVNNYAAYDIHDSMTQTHSLYLKWIDGAGTDNLVSWATSSGPVSDSHPDINGGTSTQVQRIAVNVPATITLPTLTAPSVTYTVTNNGSGAYTYSGAASGDNPNLGPVYRGGTYTFNINASGHPLYLTTDNGTNFSAGTYFGEYTDGVTGSRTDSGTLTITIPNNAPDTLYYQCGNHSAMRGAITVKDLAVQTNINGNYVVYFQHTQEGHKTPVELRPIPSLVNQMCLVYDATSGKFVPQDLATYVENTPSFENKIREVAGTAELVVEDGSAVIAKVNVYDDSTYLPLTGNNAGDQAFATDTDILYIWDGSAWQQAGAANTDDLSEGSTNLFYTDTRVGTYLSSNGYDIASNIVASIVDTAPTTLDTLNELAAALGDDPNFATTVTNSIATKLASADFTSTADTWMGTKSTTDLAEGTNLYYTDARTDARIATASIDDLSNVDITTTAPTANQSLIWDAVNSKFVPGDSFSQSDFDTAFAAKISNPVTFGGSVTATSFSGDGSALTNIPSGVTRYTYVATAGQTSFSATYTTGNVDVYLNGVKLIRTTEYDDTSGTAIVLTAGADLNDNVDITTFSSYSVADVVPASTGGTFTGPVIVNDTFTANNISSSTNLTAGEGGNIYLYASAGYSPRLTNSRDINDLSIFTNNVERLTVMENGNVGIGTSTPSSKLDLVGDLTITDGNSYFDSSDEHGYARFTHNYGNAQIGLFRTGNSIGGMYIGGNSSQFAILNQDRTQRWSITQDGIVQAPYQPMFQAWANSGGNEYFAGGTNPSFSTVSPNVGNHFDGTTFTAPVAGKYLFSYSILSGTSGNYGLIALNVNGGPAVGSQNWSQHYTSTTNDQQNSATQILNLAANDQVNLYIHTSYNSFYWSGNYSKFFGYLLG